MIQGAAVNDQPHSRTPDEMAVARAIGDFTEHQAAIPPRLKALAVNAVGPALQARGEWMRLTTRQAVAVAVLVAVKADLEASIPAMPDVQGCCPACLRSGLFLGGGGYVTCPQIDCPDPCAADTLLREALARTTPDNPAASGDRADNSLIGQPDRPRHPDGEVYSYAELQAGNWGFCDGCRMWTNGTVERPHQCTATHAHGPVTDDGPTVAECAADDRRWPLQKEGE